MKNRVFTILAVIFTAFSLSFCTENNVEKTEEKVNVEYTESASTNSEGKEILESKCLVCHKIQDNQKAMLAPPFAHIKKKYSKVTKSEEAFIKAFVDFTINPTEDKAMMFGALKQFKVMPNMAYEKLEMEKIANYIYQNDFPEPAWCN